MAKYMSKRDLVTSTLRGIKSHGGRCGINMLKKHVGITDAQWKLVKNLLHPHHVIDFIGTRTVRLIKPDFDVLLIDDVVSWQSKAALKQPKLSKIAEKMVKPTEKVEEKPDPYSSVSASDLSILKSRIKYLEGSNVNLKLDLVQALETMAEVQELVKKNQPKVTKIEMAGLPDIQIDSKTEHYKTEEVLLNMQARVPIMLVGPAGTGKTYLCERVAQLTNVKFGSISLSEGTKEADLFGKTLPTGDHGKWEYLPASFIARYEEGGVFLLDEIDSADSNLLVSMNSAIANGKVYVPNDHRIVQMHKDFVLIAAANTFGKGADRMYVGRNALDAATLDRYSAGTILVYYDRNVDEKLALTYLDESPANTLLTWSWAVREKIEHHKLRRLMSTRTIENNAKILAVGKPLEKVKETFFLGWSDDETHKMGTLIS